MRANPNPDESVGREKITRRAIMVADAGRPQITLQLLEMERGIKRIIQPKHERLPRKLLSLRRQCDKPLPERRINLRLHLEAEGGKSISLPAWAFLRDSDIILRNLPPVPASAVMRRSQSSSAHGCSIVSNSQRSSGEINQHPSDGSGGGIGGGLASHKNAC